MPHILFINQHYYPDFAATGQLLSELCEDLAVKNWKVTVITGMPEIGTYPKNYSKPLSFEEKKNISIYRIYNHPAGSKNIFNRLLHFFSFWVGSILKSLIIEKMDLVYVMSSPPLLNGITANILRVVRGVPYIYNVQDLYPGIAVEMGTISNQKLISISEKIEKFINLNSLSVFTLSDQMKESIAHNGIQENKISVIPNWSDGEIIFPKKSSELRNQLGLESKFLITYSGNIGLSQGLEKIILIAEQIKEINREIHFLIIGNGANLPFIRKLAEEKQLNNITFLPFQPKEELCDSLNCADLHIVPMAENMAKYLMPSKIYGIMAAGKPFLAIVDEGTEIYKLINETECGFQLTYNRYQEAVNLLVDCLNEKDRLAEMGRKGRKYFEENFDRKMVTEKYNFLLESSLPDFLYNPKS